MGNDVLNHGKTILVDEAGQLELLISRSKTNPTAQQLSMYILRPIQAEALSQRQVLIVKILPGLPPELHSLAITAYILTEPLPNFYAS